MDIALWIVSGALAAAYLMAGTMKAFRPKKSVWAASVVRTSFRERHHQRLSVLQCIYRGKLGYFSRSLEAYGRAGAPCRRCASEGRGRVIVREPFMNRSSYRCTRCQPVPRNARF